MRENPFPGMNPYLEDPQLWPGVYYRFVTYLADAIAPSLQVSLLQSALAVGYLLVHGELLPQ
ncbi:MAG: hypothetical protein KatS3mg022_2631 [Armatimonadota bacterium]|nr:MAG: hypothetical protein KatS3mg022_2631 [Armatimonadota bacterium]